MEKSAWYLYTPDLVTPLVAEVSVEVHPGAEAECSWVGVPVLPPQPVRGVGKLVPGHNSGHSVDQTCERCLTVERWREQYLEISI